MIINEGNVKRVATPWILSTELLLTSLCFSTLVDLSSYPSFLPFFYSICFSLLMPSTQVVVAFEPQLDFRSASLRVRTTWTCLTWKSPFLLLYCFLACDVSHGFSSLTCCSSCIPFLSYLSFQRLSVWTWIIDCHPLFSPLLFSLENLRQSLRFFQEKVKRRERRCLQGSKQHQPALHHRDSLSFFFLVWHFFVNSSSLSLCCSSWLLLTEREERSTKEDDVVDDSRRRKPLDRREWNENEGSNFHERVQ